METIIPHYYDPADMSICVDTDQPMSMVLEKTQADMLTYPLVYDPALGMAKHITHFPFCSASFMYGPQADNILGMNIHLDGKTLKIGGRTVKNCTGFDLVRFICSSPGIQIVIKDVVLRLRPMRDQQRWLRIEGRHAHLEAFRNELIHSAWAYETTALDFHIQHGRVKLYLAYVCMNDQETLFQDHFHSMAEKHQLTITLAKTPKPFTGPMVQFKTVMSDVIPRALCWVNAHGGEAYGFCGSGFGMYRAEKHQLDLEQEHRNLAALGGHLFADDFTPPTQGAYQSLEQQLHSLLNP